MGTVNINNHPYQCSKCGNLTDWQVGDINGNDILIQCRCGHSETINDKSRPFHRIDRILTKLNKLWRKNPDLRFYQLIDMLSDKADEFYTEDDELEKSIDEYLAVL